MFVEGETDRFGPETPSKVPVATAITLPDRVCAASAPRLTDPPPRGLPCHTGTHTTGLSNPNKIFIAAAAISDLNRHIADFTGEIGVSRKGHSETSSCFLQPCAHRDARSKSPSCVLCLVPRASSRGTHF